MWVFGPFNEERGRGIGISRPDVLVVAHLPTNRKIAVSNPVRT